MVQRISVEIVVVLPKTTYAKVKVEIAMRVEAAPKILDKGL